MKKARLALAHALDFIDDRIIGHRLYPWFCNICYDVWPDAGLGHSCWVCDKLWPKEHNDAGFCIDS